MFLLACAVDSVPADSSADTAAAVTEPDFNGRVEEVDGRDVVYLWGTREEIGYAEGALYCDRVIPLFRDYLLATLVDDYSDYGYELIRPVVVASVSYEPGDLAEITAMYQGMVDHCSTAQLTIVSDLLESDSGGARLFELDDLLFANAVADFGCSSFSVWGERSATGDTVHGRNFDWATDPDGVFLDEHVLKVYDSTEEGLRFASLMVPGMAGCVSCITEEMVGLTMHNVSPLDPDQMTGISPRMLSARAALAATIEAEDLVGAAETVLDARRQLTGNNLHLSFPLSRGDGIGAVVFEVDGNDETTDGQATVRRPGEDPDFARTDAIVATNHYIKRRTPDSSGDSYERAMTLRADLDATEQVDTEAGRGFLQDVARDQDGITAHSVVFDMANHSLDLYVAPDPATPAVDAEPVHLDLDAIFAGFEQD